MPTKRPRPEVLPDAAVDDRLWGGAAAEGWAIEPKLAPDGRVVTFYYIAPSGARLTSKSEALDAAEDGGIAALSAQLLEGLPSSANSASASTALQAARSEGLVLERSARAATGYANVNHSLSYGSSPYKAEFSVAGKKVRLGFFASAEEAALACARYRATLRAARATAVGQQGATANTSRCAGSRSSEAAEAEPE